jgi:hypothetical protein
VQNLPRGDRGTTPSGSITVRVSIAYGNIPRNLRPICAPIGSARKRPLQAPQTDLNIQTRSRANLVKCLAMTVGALTKHPRM